MKNSLLNRKATFTKHCVDLLELARSENLSPEAISLLEQMEGRVRADDDSATDANISFSDALGKIRGAINDADDIKRQLYERAPGTANWGEEALVFIEKFWR